MRAVLPVVALFAGLALAQEEPQPTDPVDMTPRAQPSPTRALVGATIIPGDGSEPVEDGVLLLRGQRIVAVGPTGGIDIPDDAEITDLPGKWIMPGLVDAHVHFFQSGGLYTRPDVTDLRDIVPYEDDVRRSRDHLPTTFQRYLAAGVTSVFDAGGPLWNFEVRDASIGARAPRVAVAGPLIATEPTPRQERLVIGDDAPIISAASPEEAAALARNFVTLGPDAVKIWGIGSGRDGAARIEAITRAVAAVADPAGIPVAVHATRLETAKAAVRGGADILVHSVTDAPVDEAFISMLKDGNVTYVTTLVVQEGYADAFKGRPDLSVEERRLADPEVLSSLYEMPDALRRDRPAAGEIAIGQANARRLFEAGVRVAMGTDAGNIGTLHGGSVFRELDLLAGAGIAPLDIITIATANAAHALAPDPDFGILRPGFSADLLVLTADPLDDIGNAAAIETVYLRGQPFPRAALVPRTPEAIVQEQLEAYNRQDLEAFAATYADDIAIFNLPDGTTPQIAGRDQLREAYGRLFSRPDEDKVQCQVVERIVEGRFIIDQERCRRLDGRTIVAEATAIYEVEEGRIRRVWFAR